jgi:hypothetical protein
MLSKRERKTLLTDMVNDVDAIHDVIRPRLRKLDLTAEHEIEISTITYEYTHKLREALQKARKSL